MASSDILIAFAIATFLFAAVPGPAILYTAAQTMARGARGGLLAALGIHLGGYVHVTAAAMGLAALFALIPTLYIVLKIFGALYLIWVGIGLIRRGNDDAGQAPASIKSSQRVFAESMLVEVLNPKAALFYVAFLPQFVDPSANFPVWTQFLILGVVVNAMFGLADVFTVILTSHVVGGLRRAEGAQRWFRWIGGALMAGLGIRLAFERS
ncbi:LysE family translocator [Candidatus Raskinella chloraquaticus]|uniref:Amino acid transporter n=1 Tax=Candidatus Raskinella chloraquaticus TaxID=1951219 RepID=A0A1W9HUR7_9HYPH|nr:MAG: amino acid transporter [Proteobacteria bacterium SG_bin8]